MYPMVKFPALALYTLLQSVEILSSKGENNRIMVCSLIYMYDCLKICKVCIESRQCLAPSSDGAKIDSQQEVAALFLWICIICGMQILIVDFDAGRDWLRRLAAQRRAVGIHRELTLEQQPRAAAGADNGTRGHEVPLAVHRPGMQTAGGNFLPENLVLVTADGFGRKNLPARVLTGPDLGAAPADRCGDPIDSYRNQIGDRVAEQLN